MTAAQAAGDQPFAIVVDDEGTTVEGRWRAIDAGPTWAKHRVAIRLDEQDTSGHIQDALSIPISLSFEDEVEGYALSLRFPDADKADQFRMRLIATGVVAGGLVVGVTAAQLSSTIPSTTYVAAPAPLAAPAPRIPVEDPVPLVPLP